MDSTTVFLFAVLGVLFIILLICYIKNLKISMNKKFSFKVPFHAEDGGVGDFNKSFTVLFNFYMMNKSLIKYINRILTLIKRQKSADICCFRFKKYKKDKALFLTVKSLNNDIYVEKNAISNFIKELITSASNYEIKEFSNLFLPQLAIYDDFLDLFRDDPTLILVDNVFRPTAYLIIFSTFAIAYENSKVTFVNFSDIDFIILNDIKEVKGCESISNYRLIKKNYLHETTKGKMDRRYSVNYVVSYEVEDLELQAKIPGENQYFFYHLDENNYDVLEGFIERLYSYQLKNSSLIKANYNKIRNVLVNIDLNALFLSKIPFSMKSDYILFDDFLAAYNAKNEKEVIIKQINKENLIEEGIQFIKKEEYLNSLIDNITLPSTLKEIQAKAFSGSCLKKIIIPKNVTYIGEEAFSNCLTLEEVILQSTKLTFGKNCFLNDVNLRTINLDNGTFSFEESSFENTGIGPEIRLNKPILASNIFKNSSYIKSIKIYTKNNSLFNSNALNQIHNLEKLDFSGGMELFNFSLIGSKSNLKEIISNSLFLSLKSCNKLEKLTIYSRSNQVGSYDFSDFDNLRSARFIFDENLNEIIINSFAFYNCKKLEEFVTNKTINSIESNAFSKCFKLNKVELISSSTRIVQNAFEEETIKLLKEKYIA